MGRVVSALSPTRRGSGILIDMHRILVTLAFAVVIFRGFAAAKRGDGYRGQLVA